jgi:hypothetical protein
MITLSAAREQRRIAQVKRPRSQRGLFSFGLVEAGFPSGRNLAEIV